MILASRINLVSHSAGVIKTHSRESALDERLNPGVLILKINRMNNDDEANDANDNGEELNVGLPEPETERQELERLRRERMMLVQQEIVRLRQENAQLRAERQRELEMLEQRRLLQRQVEQRRIDLDDMEARMVVAARRRALREQPQRQAFDTHVLERQQQQQAESVEEDTEEDTDTVSLSMVEPNP